MKVVADPESRAHDAHHDALRLWLRLFTCTQLIERAIRARLRREFNMTLPRFDLMAQLERNPDGLKMGELSKRLLVTSKSISSVPKNVWSTRSCALSSARCPEGCSGVGRGDERCP